MACQCNMKRWLINGLVVAVVFFLMDMFFHHTCLGPTYEGLSHLFRPMEEARGLFNYMYAGYLLFGLLFTCIYAAGLEDGKPGWQQGLRYGIFLGLLYWGAGQLLLYPFALYPGDLLVKWFAGGMVEFAILGTLTGLIYKK